MASNHRLAIVRLVALLCALAAFASVAPAASAESEDGDAEFIDVSATSDFPEWISFRLEVESETPIEVAELYYRPANSPELTVAYPVVEPDTRVELEHELDMTIEYLPPGLDVVYYWRVIDLNGGVTDSELQTLFYMDDSQDWQTQTDGLVTLYWHDGNSGFAGDIVSTANETISELSERWGVTADEPIRIVIYGDSDDLANALPPNSAEWIGGQAHPGLNLIVAMVEPGDDAEIDRMIPHEVSHLILNQATENPYNSPPNWLDEGLAVYNQAAPDPWMTDMLDEAVDDGALIPVRALNSSFPFDPDQAYLSYAESWSIVTFIVDEFGDQEMAELVGIFTKEVSYDEAVQQALGITIEELDVRWKASLGYDGDQPVTSSTGDGDDNDAPDFAPGDTKDDDLTRNELYFLLACTGTLSLAGLGLLIAAVMKLRKPAL